MTQRTFAEFRGAYKPPRLSVNVTTRADLLGRATAIAHELENTPVTDSMNSPRAALQRELTEVSALAAGSQFTFEFEAVPGPEYDALIAACPPTPSQANEGAQFDPERFSRLLVQRCAVNPALTDADVDELWATLSDNQWRKLFTTAAAVNVGGDDVPKVVMPSALEDLDET